MTPLLSFKQYRQEYLDEEIRLEGRRGLAGLPCPDCGTSLPTYRCDDCMGGEILCARCLLKRHKWLPLHAIKVCLCHACRCLLPFLLTFFFALVPVLEWRVFRQDNAWDPRSYDPTRPSSPPDLPRTSRTSTFHRAHQWCSYRASYVLSVRWLGRVSNSNPPVRMVASDLHRSTDVCYAGGFASLSHAQPAGKLNSH